jgi:MFS family permease
VLLLLAGGLFSTLLGVRAELRGVPTAVSSLISASYYAGFLAGSRVTLRSLGRVGHIRVFAALASLLSAAILSLGLIDSPVAWAPLRFVTGLCLAGQYVVAESWLNDLATNENRGRLLAVYLVITAGAFGLGQMSIFALDARVISGFAIAAILTSLAVVPVALSEKAVAPTINEGEHISLRELARLVPTGVGTVVLVGLAHGALIGMAAIYATRVGLSVGRIGLFVAALQFGGVVLMWPVSAASDDVDRRAVGVAVSIGAMVVGGLLLLGPATSPMATVLMGLVGGLSYPLYSIAGSYTNDWIEPEHVNAAASQLVTLYGIGAMFGPFAAAGMMIVIGPSGYYWSVIALHGLVALFLIYRMMVWRAPLAKRAWSEVSIPARAFFIPATIVAMSRRRRRP